LLIPHGLTNEAQRPGATPDASRPKALDPPRTAFDNERAMPIIVAIDGPAGAGKSTIAELCAQSLGLTRVNTGAIYRALTLLALERGVGDDDGQVVALLPELEALRFEGRTVYLGDRDISSDIRTAAVTKAVSRISAIGAVREGLLQMQRTLARAHPEGAVLEGRDIGTVVFPDADVKVFLTASAEERARRRLEDDESSDADFEEVLADIRRRDAYDESREVAPLRPAEDAAIVDSTGKTKRQVVEEIVGIVRRKTA
jgi:cytidylate kinase